MKTIKERVNKINKVMEYLPFVFLIATMVILHVVVLNEVQYDMGERIGVLCIIDMWLFFLLYTRK